MGSGEIGVYSLSNTLSGCDFCRTGCQFNSGLASVERKGPKTAKNPPQGLRSLSSSFVLHSTRKNRDRKCPFSSGTDPFTTRVKTVYVGLEKWRTETCKRRKKDSRNRNYSISGSFKVGDRSDSSCKPLLDVFCSAALPLAFVILPYKSGMPADVDVLVAGSSPLSFSPDCCGAHGYDASPVILTPEPEPYRSKSGAFNFPKALGSGPAVFGTSPPTHFTFHGRRKSPTLRSVSSPALSLSGNFNQLRLISDEGQMPVAVPRRPCLVVRCDVLDLPSPNKNKKRVVFADDRGFPLTLVRTMSEPSNMPPKWSLQFFSRGTKPPEPPLEPWEVAFPQPASDYLDFRRRLDTNNVSLENVIIKESEHSVFGTVKVRNLAFHKEVFVRTTSDGWATQEDAFCAYVPNSPPAHGVTVLYDTFSFRLTLPPKSRKLEFCVCYRCSGAEYWDNNSGKNYFVAKKDPGRPETEYTPNRKPKTDDVRRECWTEFATWNHSNSDAPYW